MTMATAAVRKGIIGTFVDRPVLSTMIALATVLIGVIAFTRLPLRFMPSGLSANNLRVWIPVPGQRSPQEVQDKVIEPLVAMLRTIPGLKQLDSRAGDGGGYVGIDLDEGMVAECRKQGFDVELDDALAWLERQPEHSLAAVFSAQFIEHIPPPELERLFRATARALRPGGVMIAETVNPHSTRAAKAFWVDLTHQHPIYPEVVVALARLTGFGTGRIVFPHGSGSFRQDLVSQGEYAVVATTVPQPLVSAGQDRRTETADDAVDAGAPAPDSDE